MELFGLAAVLSLSQKRENIMHKDKRQAEADAKGDIDHRIIVAGPEARAREGKGDETPSAKTEETDKTNQGISKP